MTRGELKCEVFNYVTELINWVNSNEIEVVSITEGTSKYLLFYREIERKRGGRINGISS